MESLFLKLAFICCQTTQYVFCCVMTSVLYLGANRHLNGPLKADFFSTSCIVDFKHLFVMHLQFWLIVLTLPPGHVHVVLFHFAVKLRATACL